MTTFLIALDGASPKLINKWIDDGHLKNLSKIRRQGLSGKLESTFPPLTGPAWSSFHTGVNPGKHGIYTWLDLSDSYKGKVINGNSIKTKTIWKQISSQGGRVGLLSVPVTYPPEEVNGFVVPGFLTPSAAKNRSYPEDLLPELMDEVPDYKFLPEPYMRGKDPREWVSELKKAVRDRSKATRYLYREKFKGGTDEVVMTHFFATDQVQHFLWDEVTEDWDPRLEVFKEVDHEIGNLIDMAPDDSVFMILSDHGFGPVKKTFNINTWLESEGYLNLNQNPGTRIKRRLAKLGFTEQNTQPIGEIIYPFAKKLGIVDNPITGLSTNDALNFLFLSSKDVDWRRTMAYSRSHIGHIRLNLEDREKSGPIKGDDYGGIREEIMEKLSKIRVPETEEKLAEWVKPKEELYSGPYLDGAPDILFNSLEGASCYGSVVGYGAIMFFNSSVFSKKLHPGHHRRDGILMAYGKGVESEDRDASIMDLAPTILNLGSYKIPRQLDGEVIGEISPEDPEFYEPKDFYKEPATTEDNEEITERMEDLGYL
ncbi:alkaline phosphatase family protein [Candidatus Bipolaricaulota bacterium]|nr:alkaline phosphatase family protein [Candidatus Bipolaricaulota bacterium]